MKPNNMFSLDIKQRIKRYLIRKFQLPDRDNFEYKVRISDLQRFEGKVALVTGATGAIGTAIVLRLASEGCSVGVCGRSEEKIQHLICSIKKVLPNAKLYPILMDVTNDGQVVSAISDFVKHTHQIDILVNNAGGGGREQAKPLAEQDMSMVDTILDTNLRAVIFVSKQVVPWMKSKCYGRIINMSSVMGLCGKEKWSEYAAAKSGIIGLTKSLALEVASDNITVNSVAPGSVLQVPWDRKMGIVPTRMNAIGRSGFTDEVANIVAFLASDEAAFITGQNIVIDGGRSLGLPNK